MALKTKDATRWTVTASRREGEDVSEFCPRQTYLQTKVSLDAASVSSLTITTVFRDQSFSDESREHPDLKGNYNRSWSYLEITALSSSYHERQATIIF
jgi:hypothetical protein